MTVSDCWVTRTGDRGVEVTVTEGTAVEEGVVLHRGAALPAKQRVEDELYYILIDE